VNQFLLLKPVTNALQNLGWRGAERKPTIYAIADRTDIAQVFLSIAFPGSQSPTWEIDRDAPASFQIDGIVC
jgi:hypothetical protein